jgi:hypothetical protein
MPLNFCTPSTHGHYDEELRKEGRNKPGERKSEEPPAMTVGDLACQAGTCRDPGIILMRFRAEGGPTHGRKMPKLPA